MTWANQDLATVLPPEVFAAEYHYDAARPALAIAFTEDVFASVDATDVAVTNLATSQVGPADQVSGAWDFAAQSAVFTFPGASGHGALADGNYRATLAAGAVADAKGNLNTSPFSFDLFVLAGDTNHDRTVDRTDFTFLAANFNRAGRTFSQGEFNYDGLVDLTDFTILASKFNTTLAAAGGAVATVAMPPAGAPTT